jgi:hypothetical protein
MILLLLLLTVCVAGLLLLMDVKADACDSNVPMDT